MTFCKTMILCFLMVVLLVCGVSAQLSQSGELELETRLLTRLEGFEGEVGVYVRHLTRGTDVAIRADEVFPTASLIKVPIACGVFQKIQRGELRLDQQLKYTVDRLYPGEDLLAAFQDGKTLTLAHLVMLMLSFSDNTASLWCQELAGTGVAVNELLESLGLQKTRVNSRTPGREENRTRFGWGETTPREMAELFIRLRRGEVISPTASARIYRTLCKSYWDREALAVLPAEIQVASKQGAVNASRSEVLLVHAPGGDYVLSIITRGQKDQSWGADNAGFVLLRDVSRIVYEYFQEVCVVPKVSAPAEKISRDVRGSQSGLRLGDDLRFETADGDELWFKEWIRTHPEVRVLVLTLIAGAEAKDVKKRGGLWCEDSYSDLPLLRHARLKLPPREVAFVGVFAPPVFDEEQFGYASGAFRDAPVDSAKYRENRHLFVERTELLKQRDLFAFDECYYDPRFLLLGGKPGSDETRGRFKGAADTQTYGTPTIWVLRSDGRAVGDPFVMNVYETPGGRLRYSAADVIDRVQNALAGAPAEAGR